MKKVTYTKDQVTQMSSLLNGLTTTGIHNAKNIAIIAQIMDAGVEEPEPEVKKEGE